VFAGLGTVLFVCVLALEARTKFMGTPIPDWSVYLFVPLYPALFLFIAAALATIPFALVLVLLLLGFAPGYALYAPFIEVSVEPSLPGRWDLVQLRWAEVDTDFDVERGVLLEHAKTHDDAAAVEATVSWIAARLRAITLAQIPP